MCPRNQSNVTEYNFFYRGDIKLEVRVDINTGVTLELDYDEWGNLRKARNDLTGVDLEYYVDPMNRRIAKFESGSLVKGWVRGTGSQILAEFDGNGDITSRFVYATNSHVPDLMYSNLGGSWKWCRLVTDWRGSVRLVVEADTGTPVQHLEYSPFGRVLRDTNPGFQPFGFAGGHYDHDTGLVRFGAPDYDPLVGRIRIRFVLVVGMRICMLMGGTIRLILLIPMVR